ncbi:hypothetical protein A7P53_14525 [Acinetobacter defluvii]|uniref:Uncharacterized protein n=1 Tax=Acinetobacter defluvii TaxID=1871111 RepID=A0A2S2FCT8_9GAMM|nr:hypothetical protein [Acinetobacter defluvii]AWL28774.1 hypothetical protein DJ533_09430 [Acinetobacter defluvii]NNP73803.1 hypothetical protein [Acinetobacter defluvii]
MLVKIEDGFYLNSSHIIAIHVSKNMINQNFLVDIEYTPNNQKATGIYHKEFQSKLDADAFLQKLHQQIA